MLFSSLRHIILLSLALLLLKIATSQTIVSPFLAASAGKKVATTTANYKVVPGFLIQYSENQNNLPFTRSPFIGVRPNTYATSMAWTCRQELQLEKLLTVPLKISLGSREQVDWLEGKRRPPNKGWSNQLSSSK